MCAGCRVDGSDLSIVNHSGQVQGQEDGKRRRRMMEVTLHSVSKKVVKQNFGGDVGRLDVKTTEPPEANYHCPLGHGHS